jgi:single-strand DNA-binding protein
MQTRSWEDRDGNTRYTTEVKAREMMFLDSNRQGAPAGDGFSQDQGSYEDENFDQRPPRQQSQQSSGSGAQRSGQSGSSSQSGSSGDEETFEPDDELPF